jgi:hypothetical protein
MNYRILFNFGIFLFVILNLKCSNDLNQSDKGDIIGTWVASHTSRFAIIQYPSDDTSYGTESVSCTYSIKYDTIKILSAGI